MICNCSMAGTSACDNCVNKKMSRSDYYYIPYNPYIKYEKTPISLDDKVYTSSLKKHKPVIQYWCPECDALIEKYHRYCHNCGIQLDWSEEE